jgi:hypothetical protein
MLERVAVISWRLDVWAFNALEALFGVVAEAGE